jgi:hypothetical protein
MKKALSILIILLVLAIVFLTVFSALRSQESASNEFYKTHIIGGFSIDTPDRAARAAQDGIQVVFNYSQPPSGNSALGQKLQSLHMMVIDGYIASYLHYYECHRTKATAPPAAWIHYCHSDYYPSLTDENAFLSAIAAHLQQVKGNRLIIGYWVLDDWAGWDAGSAQQLLIKIHRLIQQYTPGFPAICGFAGGIGVGTRYYWNGWVADNFSPQGCDRIGLYIYASSLANTIPTPSPGSYNWSMSGLLPTIFASLKRRGWDIAKEPLIGIAQAFGGPRNDTVSYWITPDAKDIEMQSRSFCEHGATGLVFYGWDDATFGSAAQTPMSNTGIEMGIRNGIAACKQYWSAHP